MDQLFMLGIACLFGWYGLKTALGIGRQTPGFNEIIKLVKKLFRLVWWMFKSAFIFPRQFFATCCFFIAKHYTYPYTPARRLWMGYGRAWQGRNNRWFARW